MIRAEIRFKNSAFWSALEENGYKRQTKIRYDKLLAYANLRYIFEDDFDSRQMIMALLQSDEWTLFDQYEKVIRKEGGVKKIITDIPIDKIISLESREVLMLESPDGIDELMIKESLEIDISTVLQTLKEREREVLKMYFGIDRDYPLILENIAEEVGLSRERLVGYIGCNLKEIRDENQRNEEEERAENEDSAIEQFNDCIEHRAFDKDSIDIVKVDYDDDDVALGYSIVKSNKEVSGVFMVDGKVKDVDYFKEGEEIE